MTYSPGGPGYPSAQPPGSYGAAVPSLVKSDDTASKLPFYLTAVAAVLGFAAYLVSFGPMFTINADMGQFGGALSGSGGLALTAALLAGLLAAVSLLPKAKNFTAVVAAVAVLGALLVIAQVITKPSGFSIGWALWFVLGFTIVQAIVAVGALLLDAGVLTAPTPRPRYDQFGQYGLPPGGYYSQPGQPGGQQHSPIQQHNPQQSRQHPGYPSQYGGYQSAPSTGGFSAGGSQQGQQQGPPTPPTGFPSFSPPPGAGSGQGHQGLGSGDASQGGSGHGDSGHGQHQASSPSGPTQS